MKKNKVLLVSDLSALIYLGFAVTTLIELLLKRNDEWVAFFATVKVLLLIPGILMTFIGVLLGIKAYRKNNRWLTLVSALCYLFGALTAIQVGMFLIPAVILNVIAFIQQVIQIKRVRDAAADLIP